ncbi:hypothetical protein [Nocardioides terrisoli]|uniref:hypothetical protein n=1 Tax=Nocardioides terrisoli TaxID=3388267 RepID=UPI00287B7824|nr:hypothetical protein [Nocardioides marmorisolisilvae]
MSAPRRAPMRGRVRTWPREQLLLRAGLLLAAALGLLAGRLGGGSTPTWLLVAAGLTALTAACWPDSLAVLVLLGELAVPWLGSRATATSAWVLLGTAALLGVHLAALAATQGPPTARIDHALLWRWAARGLMLWSTAVPAWLLARLAGSPARRLATDGQAAPYAGLAGLVVIAVAAFWLFGRFSTVRRPGRARS